ncbi:ADP-ribosylation-like factor, putative [Plasmodium ovale wallikeri]|uniref:ADP-ribosylation-like factor, putative n=1 Tax=Plasmodium ovale wallikeri TaxID=864142 RepID=A0A1A8ZJ93_PLAOA|nr:ADP-ribosylation-like factor, putative [Plasmodium ovale wallikeri]SBT43926.1 ADP-ribosylation-like factor, putative [Plasmodium ovale wallikeri]
MVLLKIFKKIKERHRNIRIIILGLDNAGKTTIVKRLLGDDIYKVHPTFGFTIESFNFNNYFINIWDVGGQKSIRHYWKNYYENIDGIIYVIDSTDIFRIQLCSYELKKILKEERLFGCSLLILSNKNDIENSLSIGQIVEVLCTHKKMLSSCCNLPEECMPRAPNCTETKYAQVCLLICISSVRSTWHTYVHIHKIRGILFPLQILKLNEMNIDRHWCIRECSAFSGKGLLSSFMWLIDDISYRICKSY